MNTYLTTHSTIQHCNITETRPYAVTTQLRAKPAALPKPVDLCIDSNDLRFLTDFVKNSGFYIEDLEHYIREEQIDFWQTREHALRILTDCMLQRIEHTVH